MNLSLEAYDWWATKIPTQYRTLASNFDSKSESFQSYVQLESFKFESLKLESFSWSEVGEFLLVLESFAVKNNKVNGLEMSKSKVQNCS